MKRSGPKLAALGLLMAELGGFALAQTHTPAASDTANTFTAPQTVTHPGVFSGEKYQSYLSATVGGAFHGHSTNNLDAVAGTVTLPVGATVNYNAEGVAGYCQTNADSRRGAPSHPTGGPGVRSNCVGIFGVTESTANYGGVWGINTTTTDTAGTTGNVEIGYEADMYVLGTPQSIFGMQLTLNGSGKMPSNSYAINIEPSGIPHQGWTFGIESSDGCCTQALQVGAAGGTPNSSSQSIGFVRFDSQGKRQADGYIQETSGGDLVLGTAAARSVDIPGALLQPGVPYGNLPPSPVPGMQQFCTNCEPANPSSCSTGNPASCLCRAGRGSMWAKYENFVNNGPGWYCH
jgi:hypothetical protein